VDDLLLRREQRAARLSRRAQTAGAQGDERNAEEESGATRPVFIKKIFIFLRERTSQDRTKFVLVHIRKGT
jgi:hypothetical protein